MTSRAQLFDDLDRMDGEAWASHLAPDVVMRFGSEDPVYGREACLIQVRVLFNSVITISHEVIDRWVHGDATITELSVTFTVPNDTRLVIPMVTIYRTDHRDLIADYRVYLDPAGLWP